MDKSSECSLGNKSLTSTITQYAYSKTLCAWKDWKVDWKIRGASRVPAMYYGLRYAPFSNVPEHACQRAVTGGNGEILIHDSTTEGPRARRKVDTKQDVAKLVLKALIEAGHQGMDGRRPPPPPPPIVPNPDILALFVLTLSINEMDDDAGQIFRNEGHSNHKRCESCNWVSTTPPTAFLPAHLSTHLPGHLPVLKLTGPRVGENLEDSASLLSEGFFMKLHMVLRVHLRRSRRRARVHRYM